MKDEKLPPVVYGDPLIDGLNQVLWSLEVPRFSAAVQHLQQAVVEIERAIDNERTTT